MCVCELHINILGQTERERERVERVRGSEREVIINPLNFRFADSDKRCRRRRRRRRRLRVVRVCVFSGSFFLFF